MRLLILSFYYPPDLSAGSFRMHALVKALQLVGGDDLQIDLITSMPNRYSTHQTAAATEEVLPGLRIRRIALPAHSSGMWDQARSFVAFARKVQVMVRHEHFDLIFATSSRLMTAVLGAYLAGKARAPLYLDIRDLFTDTISDLLAESPARHLLPIFYLLERRAFRSASRVNVVSEGFLDHARRIAPEQDFRVYTNGIDTEYLDADFNPPRQAAVRLPLILYAGNIGEGQGLHRILPRLAHLLQGKARLRVLGDGGRRRELETAIHDAGCANIEIRSPVARSELHKQYCEADILFLHLNDHKAFHKVLPSKIFEYAATGKPILAGVSGYAAHFMDTHITGCRVTPPCHGDAMVAAALDLIAGQPQHDRTKFCKDFARDRIMAEMAEDIMKLTRPPRNPSP